MSDTAKSSRISGFHRLSSEDRRARIGELTGLSPQEMAEMTQGATLERLEAFAENVICGLQLHLRIATNFRIDGEDILIPMAVEETSVIAAASNAARLARAGGGFTTELLEDLVIGQVEILDISDPAAARQALEAAHDEIVALANTAEPPLHPFGGGCRGMDVRWLAMNGLGDRMVVHLLVDCVDAMGANSVNAMCERVAPVVAELTDGRAGLRILSNLADHRRARARVCIPAEVLAFGRWSGAEVRDQVIGASRFAEADAYRAATHNKGIMNGVDPVLIATGNDWRAMEAGCHAFAARQGRYGPLATWDRDDRGNLVGTAELPFQLGTVGGVTRLHPTAAASLKVLGSPGAARLGRIIAAVALAQNLAALRALSTEGINKGHMRLHERNAALASQDDGGPREQRP